jgi:hypothetical protein
MRKFFLSIVLAFLLVGTVAVSAADAQWRRSRAYYYSYPAYSYPTYSYSYYYAPDAGVSYAPDYYYGPSYYYPAWRSYRWRGR